MVELHLAQRNEKLRYRAFNGRTPDETQFPRSVRKVVSTKLAHDLERKDRLELTLAGR